MKEGQPSVIYLKDYQVPDFLIEETVLSFDINEGETQVTSELRMVRNPAAAPSESGAEASADLDKLAARDNHPVSPFTHQVAQYDDQGCGTVIDRGCSLRLAQVGQAFLEEAGTLAALTGIEVELKVVVTGGNCGEFFRCPLRKR